MTLPPGQRRLNDFPRFGAHFGQPPPDIPTDPVIEIRGAVPDGVEIPVRQLTSLPRRSVTADFHCVAGWSATGLLWEGVGFETFYRMLIEPSLPAGTTITHFAFAGLDGYKSIVTIDDALGDEVLIADRLNGRPLDPDHGAPARLVSPKQYGFISTKHLCRVEVHTTEPRADYHPNPLMQFGLQLVKPHERARVWEEERHRYLPAALVRPIYRLLIAPIRRVSAIGSRPATQLQRR